MDIILRQTMKGDIKYLYITIIELNKKCVLENWAK